MPMFRFAAIASAIALSLVLPAHAQPCGGFITQPADQHTCVGSRSVILSATPSSQPTAYQWLLDGQPIRDGTLPTGELYSGTATSTLWVRTSGGALTPAVAGRYSLMCTQACGTVTSREALLSFYQIIGPATFELSSQFVCIGETITLTARVPCSDGIDEVQTTSWTPTSRQSARTIRMNFPCGVQFDLQVPPTEAFFPEGWVAAGIPYPLVDALASGSRKLGLRPDGSLVAWQDSASGPVFDPNVPQGPFREIADAADGEFLLIRTDGTLALYGSSPSSPFAQLPAGRFLSGALVSNGVPKVGAAVREDGALLEWGLPSPPNSGVDPTLYWTTHPWGRFLSISSYAQSNRVGFTAVREDGMIFGWGNLQMMFSWAPRAQPLRSVVVDAQIAYAIHADGSREGRNYLSGRFVSSAGSFGSTDLVSIYRNGHAIERSTGMEVVLSGFSSGITSPVRAIRGPRVFAGAILNPPQDTTVTVHRSATFNTGPTRDGISYRWSKDGVDLADGPTGAGSVVSGALSATLRIDDARAGDSGLYSLTTVSPCETRSASATLTVRCATDLNADGTIDADDLGDFLTCFFSIPPCPGAEFTGDDHIDADDLGEFINAYFSGCEG